MSSDEQQLREWMQQTYGGLHPGRSTCSHALEFLKTERANRTDASARLNFQGAAASLEQALIFVKMNCEWMDRALAEIRRLGIQIPAAGDPK